MKRLMLWVLFVLALLALVGVCASDSKNLSAEESSRGPTTAKKATVTQYYDHTTNTIYYPEMDQMVLDPSGPCHMVVVASEIFAFQEQGYWIRLNPETCDLEYTEAQDEWGE